MLDLHAKRHLVLVDPRLDFSVGRAGELVLVQLVQPVEQHPPAFAAHARRVVEVEHRIERRAEEHALMPRRAGSRCPRDAIPGAGRSCPW